MSHLIPNTFGLTVMAREVVTVTTKEQLYAVWQAHDASQPIMILGEGSNSLFLSDFNGTVIVNRIKGLTIQETDQEWLLRVGAGEHWHQLVQKTVEKGIAGLENLALIPGCVGSAAIQNIGAYGLEFQGVADYVELLDFKTGNVLTIRDGQYGYRESIFKQRYAKDYAVIYVGIRLSKQWNPILTYGELKKLDSNTVTPEIVFEKVCEIRRSKLPDPSVLGNGGSFFKNPVVDKFCMEKLRELYPTMPVYPQPNGQFKLAAGWLIESCGLKGHQCGGAAVHEQQALVLVNKDNATPQDVINLAKLVKQSVSQKFNVDLEPEIRFIGADGEVNATAYL